MAKTSISFLLNPSGCDVLQQLHSEHDDLDLWDNLTDEHEDLLQMSDDNMELEDDIQYIQAIDSSAGTTGQDNNDKMDEDGAHSEGSINDHDEALESLEDIVLTFLTQLLEALPNAYSQPVESKKRSGKKLLLKLSDRSKGSLGDQMAMRTLVFPRKSPGPSARPFAQLFRVIDLMHEALVDGVPMTKRDLYYKDVQLFRSQAIVDRLVDDLAATLQLSRADLNVRASPKGLMCGLGFVIHMRTGEHFVTSDGEQFLIPESEDIEQFEVDKTLAWVLIVEKEAVFQTLCRLRFATNEGLPGPGLIVTGKGYPDVATRQLVKTLSDNLPAHIPILALVDGDAFGIDILSVYKQGSSRMRHENARLAAERVQWLGLWSSELTALGIDMDALLPITKHDEKKARALLKRPGLPAQCRKELQFMLFSRRKAEIEVLGAARPIASKNSITDLANADPDPPSEAANPGIPLLHYLVSKIRFACAEADR